jgi:hypothetical protein
LEPSYPQIVAAEIEGLREESAASVVRRWLGQPEDLYLDFKIKDPKGGSQTASANDKRNLAKAVSGFGNSDGGLIVWGIEAKRSPNGEDVASELKTIDGLATFHSDLNDLIRNATKPTVPGVVNYRVFEDKPGDRGYVVTFVPPGTHPPYRAEYDNNNHFYKRAGSQFYPMEPYDLRDVIFRQNYPKLEVELESEDEDTSNASHHIYSLRVVIRNRGPLTLLGFKLVIDVPAQLYYRPFIDERDIQFAAVRPIPVDRAEGVSAFRTVRREGIDYQRLEVVRPSSAHPIFRLFPEDEEIVVGRSTLPVLRYRMNYDLFQSRVRDAAVHYTLYGENIPPLSGSKRVRDLIHF